MKIRPIKTSLLRQNCYVRDFSDTTSSHIDPPDTFLSLDEVTTEDGIKLVLSEQPYPITSESVNSYVAGSDYRLDPAGAVARAPKRTNLGDVTELQSVDRMDMETAMSMYKKLSEKIQSALSSASVPVQETKQSDSEVKKDE